MKNRVIAIILIVIILLVGYFGCKFLDKKESNETEIALVEEEPKVEEEEEVKEEVVVKKDTPKKTTTQKKKVVKKTTKTTTPKVSYNKNELKQYAHDLVLSYGWTENDYECLVKLWNRESGWRPNAVNKSSGACGIPQALPCKKMSSEGSDYATNGKTQIRWGLKYIKNRYGSPSKAWAHSQQKGWY